MLGNPLKIGRTVGTDQSIELPAKARDRHLYVCGGTGVGKSKFLEHCIRQDILNSRKSRCGLILFDPHGLVYKNTLAWAAKHGLNRHIIPINLGKDDWIISYNALRRRTTDPAVVVANFVDDLAHVWGEEGTDRTPLLARYCSVFLRTLYENDCTISDIMYLISNPSIRRAMAAKVADPVARQLWTFADRYPKEFELQLTSTVNRFPRLVGAKVMRAMLGQPHKSLDLLEAMETGKIILCNLSTEGGHISEEDTDTFGTLLLSDLWTAASSRPKRERENAKPFYVYIDECQKFITPTIANNLDQARGFGLYLTLANQYPRKLLISGVHGEAMYHSIITNAENKVVFRLGHPDDARVLGQWLFMNTFDVDEVKLRLFSTKVMGYKEETREIVSSGTSHVEGKSSGHGHGSFHGISAGDGLSGMESFNPNISGSDPITTAEGWNSYVADSSGESESWFEQESEAQGTNESVTHAPMLIPQMGKEISSVQYRSIEEQIFRATQKLFDQQDRHFAIRYAGGPKAPLFVKTPTVKPPSVRKQRVDEYRLQLLRELECAMPMVDASKLIDGREQKLIAELVDVPFDEPTSAKRRIR